jgi:hypothetical protein
MSTYNSSTNTSTTSNTYSLYITGGTSTNIITGSVWASTDGITTDGITAGISTDSIKSIIRSFGIDTTNRKIDAQHGWSVETPDGTVINIDYNGNIEIKDSDAKIVYKANRIREFNQYLNASDLLEKFIKFVGSKGVRQNEVLNIPIEIFINWLIMEAAIADGEDPPKLPLSKPREYDRCLHCGKFIKKSLVSIAKFCNPDHYSQYLLKGV